jgi:hypothetical protein
VKHHIQMVHTGYAGSLMGVICHISKCDSHIIIVKLSLIHYYVVRHIAM